MVSQAAAPTHNALDFNVGGPLTGPGTPSSTIGTSGEFDTVLVTVGALCIEDADASAAAILVLSVSDRDMSCPAESLAIGIHLLTRDAHVLQLFAPSPPPPPPTLPVLRRPRFSIGLTRMIVAIVVSTLATAHVPNAATEKLKIGTALSDVLPVTFFSFSLARS
ncbi:hypothetical protein CH63R_01021 [Colletotrichum higginsianum IMI 349063]|uniref:Uncharacterized protein n=1 Tax=Colletotrichum higginsianum (strain IMI 349063) TaxID=759273 RepID=A0A1B7YUX0_COLHI|nr:hypothetical protein CH63R_01021 [Colletotrichum higginsianum IMI 349063]OBR15841.1 hypothetical protein CH63R_01021 [Colletotrichum higginsianum IMI 349063]